MPWLRLVHPFDGYDWDDGNLPKVESRVRSTEIEWLFRNFVAMGRGQNGRPLYAIYTTRRRADKLLLRVISARYMHAKERRIFEEIEKIIP